MLNHTDISRLCDKKIVATPHSGGEPRKMLNMWLSLDENNRNHLKNIYHKESGWTLDVFVYNSDRTSSPHIANIIIFYVVEYLELLAIASDKTPEELLNIFAVVQYDNKFNKDLIKIAFGDIFGMSWDATSNIKVDIS
jgi:hypothetical protein